MSTITLILLGCACFALCFYLVGMSCAALHVRRAPPRVVGTSAAPLPPVSLLKPVKGLEENLELCLRSFFEQEYPGTFELVFASASRDDPAMRVARRIARDYPHVPARFVLTDENWGLNPKVSNLQGALAAAAHDLVLQTDANVWAPRDYLRSVVGELLASKGSLLSSLVTGIGERSPGAAMENLQLTAYVAPACCTALMIGGIPCVIGKSMLLRRSELKALGGLELVKNSLAEDFLLGRHYADAGKKVVLSSTPIRNFNRDMPVERSLGRHARWLKMRAVIHVPGFFADVLANPIGLTFLAWLSAHCDRHIGLALAALMLFKPLVDSQVVRVVRGVPMKPQHVLWSPVKDLLMLGVWFYAMFSRSIEWRGIRFRLGSDSQLLPDEGALPVRVLKRLLSA